MKKAADNCVGSKWVKTKTLLRDKEMRKLVPDTQLLSAESLRQMLRRHRMVYVKPVKGTSGNGVMRVEQLKMGKAETFTFQLERTKRTFTSYDALYRSILSSKLKGAYLVQKGVHLLTHKGRRFDVRVMVQRDAGRVWQTTGIIGRVAHPAKIITNYHGGGTPRAVNSLLKPILGGAKAVKLEQTLSKVGKDAAIALSRTYPRLNMVGADIGIDSELKPWIIELNTRPDPYIFRHSADKRVYRRVLHHFRILRQPLPKQRKGGFK